MNGTKFTSPGGYWENGQFWRLREVSASFNAPEHVGEPSPRARRELRARRPQSARLDEVHRHRSGSELLGTGDVQTDFITHRPPTYFTFRLNLHY